MFQTPNLKVEVWSTGYCWRITEDNSEIISGLECSHEEAETRMLLHAKYANGPVVIHADDTDVFMLPLGHSNVLSNAHIKVEKGSKTRIIDIDKVKGAIVSKLHAQISSQEFCRSLIGMHAFTYTAHRVEKLNQRLCPHSSQLFLYM